MKYEYYQDEKSPQPEWRWRLQDDQGQTIATSHDGHPTLEICPAEIEKVKLSSIAIVVEKLNINTSAKKITDLQERLRNIRP